LGGHGNSEIKSGCIARQKLHGVTSSVSWSIVSEEVSCYGTNRRQKVLTEQDVTVIAPLIFKGKGKGKRGFV